MGLGRVASCLVLDVWRSRALIKSFFSFACSSAIIAGFEPRPAPHQ